MFFLVLFKKKGHLMEKLEEHFHIKKAVIFALGAAIFFSLMALFAKLAVAHTTINVIVLFRFGVSLLYILLIFGFKKIKNKVPSLKTKHIFLYIFCSILAFSMMTLLYFSLKYIPLVDGNLLVMTNPLFIPIIGALFLHHKTNKKHWIAIVIGFLGVAFILKPGHELYNPMAFFALLAGLCAAIALLIIRRLRKYDNHYVCMFYYFLITFVISGVFAIFNWKTPDFHT